MGRLLKPDRLFQVLLGPVEGGPYCIFCNVLSIISAVKWLRENASALTVRVVGSLITAVILYLCSLIPKLAPYLAYRLPVWLSLSILIFISGVIFAIRLPRPDGGNRFDKGQVVLHVTPRLISEADPASVGEFPSDVLRLPEGGISTWVYLHRFGEGMRQLENYRYIVAHATHTSEPYKNVFALCRGPRWESPREPQWRLWLANAKGERRVWCCSDTRDLEPGWHHFTLRWRHSEPLLEMLIDGRPSLRASQEYEAYWPVEYGRISIGCWCHKWYGHFANTYFWRTQALPKFPGDKWIVNETSREKPPDPT